ncbi:unnamed protein product [Lymnaea stagnalis]|uniref:C2H2-type domain-containing protein n=1 Tax=Lymnaea stagnalis TaxID=6523 RepID=A0AAV2I117_LYMST
MSEEIHKSTDNPPIPQFVHHGDKTKSLPVWTLINPEIVIDAVYSLAAAEGRDRGQHSAVMEQKSCNDTLQTNFPIQLSSLPTASKPSHVLAGQECVSIHPSTSSAHKNTSTTAGSSGSGNFQSPSVDPTVEGDVIHNLAFPRSNSEHISTNLKGNDNSKGLSESSNVGSSSRIVSENSPQVTNKEPTDIVDLETEDIDDCMLVKIDLSKRICKFGPVISEEVVIEDSDEEFCVNKEECTNPIKSSEFELSSSNSPSVSNLSIVCGKAMSPKTLPENPLISKVQVHREESPTLDMEVENIKEEILIDVEEDVSSDEQVDVESCAEKPICQPQNFTSAESSPYSCKPCSKSFPNRTSLVTHILACHMSKPPPKELLEKLVYPCQNCSQLFKSDSLLVNHECSSCNIKSHMPTQYNSDTSLPAVSETSTIKRLLSAEKRESTLTSQDLTLRGTALIGATASKVIPTPCSQNSINTAPVTIKKEVPDTTEEIHKDGNLSEQVHKEKETPSSKINQSHEQDAENKKKAASLGAPSSSASNVTVDTNKQKEQVKQKIGEKTVWCYACSTWFTTYTELKLHLKIKPQCKVTNDEFYLQNVKNKTFPARSSYATKATTDNKSQPAKSSDVASATTGNKSQPAKSSDVASATTGNKSLLAKSSDAASATTGNKSQLAKASDAASATTGNNSHPPVLKVNEPIKSEPRTVVMPKTKIEPLKIKIGPSYCVLKSKKVCFKAADEPSEDNAGGDAVGDDRTVTAKHLHKEGCHEFPSKVDLLNPEADQKCQVTDTKLNRAVVQLKPMSAMCKVCQKAFTDEQSLVKHLQNNPKCLSSNKPAEQCKSCLCWFLNYEDLSKHAQMSKSCQVGTSKEMTTNDSSGDGLKCDSIKDVMDQHPLSGCTKMDLSSDDDSDDVDEISSSEEGDVEYKCRHCDMVFTQKYQCKRHMKESHGLPGEDANNKERGKKLRCKSCTKKFDSVTLLQAHLLQNKCCFLAVTYSYWNTVQNEKHLCLLCTKIFPSDKMLRRHCFKNMACRLSYTSLVLKGVVDDKTSSPILDNKMVTNNLTVVEGNRILPARDDGVLKRVTAEVSSSVQDLNVSSSVGATQNTLKASQSGLNNMGKNKNNRVCKNCGANYVTFVDHVLKEKACCSYYAAHTEESPTNSFCFVCKKQFKNKRLFNTHLCSNAGETMSEAGACTAAASQNPTSHVSKSEEFPCMICDAKFSILRQLLEHSYQHTNPISQVCQRCNLNFSHYNRFVSHMAFHIRMDKESGSTSEQADNHPTKSAKVSDSLCLKSEAAQSFQGSVRQQKFSEIPSFKDHMASNDPSRPTSHSCPICLQLFKSKEAVDKHKRSHEISRTSPSVNFLTTKFDPSPATEKKINCKFPQPCGICNKLLNSLKDKKKHMSCSALCRNALSNLEARKEITPDQVRDNNSGKNNSLIQHNAALPSEEGFKCMFCLQEFISDQEKLRHISQSQCCKSILKFVLDNKLYAIPLADSDTIKKQQYNSKRCEFCLKIIEDKIAHLLGSACIKALEDAIIAYKSNATVKVSPKNSQESTDRPAYSCEICQRMFSTKGSLSHHKRKKHQEMGINSHLSQIPIDHHLYCFQCKKFLETSNDVELHNTLSHSRKLLSRGTLNNAVFTPGQLRCKICDIKYLGKQKGRLLNHMHAKHNEGTSKLLSLQNNLPDSKNVPAMSPGDVSPKTADSFPSNSVFSCTFCGMIVSHKGKNSHFQVHISKFLQAVKKKSDMPMNAFSRESCPLCKKVYSSRKTLRIHLLQHTANDIVFPGSKPKTFKKHLGPVRCIVCKRFFSSRNTLGHHALTAHNKIFLEDPLIFGIPSSMAATRTKKTKLKIKTLASYQCDICSRIFRNKSTFKFHRIFHRQSVGMLGDSSEPIPNKTDRKKLNSSEPPALLHQCFGDSYITAEQERKMADESERNIVDESGTNTITAEESKHLSIDRSAHLSTGYESCRVECRSGFSLRPLHKAILNCHICQISIRKDEYTDHLLNDHKLRLERIYNCSFCDLKFPASRLAGEHMRQCSLDSRCILCQEQLPGIKFLKSHVIQGHRQTWADYISRTVATAKIGIDNGGLKISSPTESSLMDSPRTCLLCKATFNEKSFYISHLQEHTKSCMISLYKLDNSCVTSKPSGLLKEINQSTSFPPQDVSGSSPASHTKAEVSGQTKVFMSHVLKHLKSEKQNDVYGDMAGAVDEQYQCADAQYQCADAQYLCADAVSKEQGGLISKQLHGINLSVPNVSVSDTGAGSSRSDKLIDLNPGHVKAIKRAIVNCRTKWEDDCGPTKTMKLNPSNQLENVGAFKDK